MLWKTARTAISPDGFLLHTLNSRAITRSIIASFLVLVLLGGSQAFAASPLKFSATGAGGVTDAGTQVYLLRGGQVAAFIFQGTNENPSTLQLRYSLSAVVSSRGVTGRANLEISSQGSDSNPGLDIQVQTNINSSIGIPVGTSQVPFYLTGPATINVQGSGSYNTIMQFESPWWNPFGGPLLFASADGSFVLVATYTVGIINWRNVQDQGLITGTLGSKGFTGTFTQNATAIEDMVTGKEIDLGTMQLTGLPAPYGTVTGHYLGSSYIPTSTAEPEGLPVCPAIDPSNLGVCTETGDVSTGHFFLSGQGLSLIGQYNTNWNIPSTTFATSVSGTGTSH
jgi:hypothetical protein